MESSGTARVAIGAGKDRIEAAREALFALGGIGKWVKPGDRVLLKPNIMSTGSAPMITDIAPPHRDHMIEFDKKYGAKIRSSR